MNRTGFVCVYVRARPRAGMLEGAHGGLKGGIRSLGAGVIGVCKLHDVGTGFRTLSLLEQQALLTPGPSLQPPNWF